MERQKQSYGYAIIAVFLWATVASAFKVSLRYLDFLQLLLLASVTSLAALLLVLVVQNRAWQLTTCSRTDYFRSALLGFINPFLYYVCLFKAYALLPAQQAQPLNYTWPIMLVLLSIPLLNQKINTKSFVAIVISFIGVFIISTQGNILDFRFANFGGALLALSTAVIWACFWIFNMKDEREETVKLCLNFLFGLGYILIATIIFSEFSMPGVKGLLGAMYVGLFEMGITFVIWSKALKLSETTAKVSRFIYLVPFLSLVVVYFIVGETILPSTIMGLLFIVTGIVLEQFNSQKRIYKKS